MLRHIVNAVIVIQKYQVTVRILRAAFYKYMGNAAPFQEIKQLCIIRIAGTQDDS